MNLVYIVSAYKLPDQLTRLVTRLNTESSRFFIHVDRKADRDTHVRMVTPLSRLSNVHFLERHRCYYGGFGHVRATIKAIEEIRRQRLAFDYAILLTGQDYPVVATERIADFFTQQDGRSFIEHFPLPHDEWDHRGMDRIEAWHVWPAGRRVSFGGRAWRVRRRFPSGLSPFGGSSYWCLSSACVDYVSRFLNERPSYTRFFKYVSVPEELFFQTILLNSPLAETLVNDDLRYLEWRDPLVAGGPAVLGKGDFDKIISSGKLFARKFDITQDAEVLDMIDDALRGSRTATGSVVGGAREA